LLDQLAALKKTVEDLLNRIASLKAQLEHARGHSHRPAAGHRGLTGLRTLTASPRSRP
jgi:hypothetical protein